MAKAKEDRGLSYASSGVSIDQGNRFVELIQKHMRNTHGPRVLANEGGFAGLFRLDFNEQLFKRNFKHPVLVASTDGVGTKIKLGIELGRYEELGVDLVAMSVNDLVVQGAEPLFFLDYIAVHQVEPELLEQIVRGIASACRVCDCALLGGETAELNDLYAPGDLDLAGFAVGVLELDRAVDSERVEPGDVVIGLESDGVHSNGYSLVRRIVKAAGLDLHAPAAEVDASRTLGDVLMTPTRLYAASVTKLLRRYRVKKVVSGMAHITGGGLQENLARALHGGVDALIDRGAWPVPAVFQFLQAQGKIDPQEMERVFNMGIGYCLIVRPAFAASIMRHLERFGERGHVIGTIETGSGAARWR